MLHTEGEMEPVFLKLLTELVGGIWKNDLNNAPQPDCSIPGNDRRGHCVHEAATPGGISSLPTVGSWTGTATRSSVASPV